MTKKNDPISSMNFEQAQEALAEVLSQLEDKPTDLEGSVSLFERGKALIDHCQMLLDQAELKVSQLEDNGEMTPMEY
jgi:exodeoxyribonuclease VII small subunit